MEEEIATLKAPKENRHYAPYTLESELWNNRNQMANAIVMLCREAGISLTKARNAAHWAVDLIGLSHGIEETKVKATEGKKRAEQIAGDTILKTIEILEQKRGK